MSTIKVKGPQAHDEEAAFLQSKDKEGVVWENTSAWPVSGRTESSSTERLSGMSSAVFAATGKVIPPDAARLQQIRVQHTAYCFACGNGWRCFQKELLEIAEAQAATLRHVQQERDYWEKWASHVDDVQTRRLAESHQHQQALRAEVQRLSAQVEDLEFAAVKKCGVCGLSHMASTYNGNGISGWAECHYYKEVQRLTQLADKHHQAVVVAEEHVQRLTAERDVARRIARKAYEDLTQADGAFTERFDWNGKF